LEVALVTRPAAMRSALQIPGQIPGAGPAEVPCSWENERS
jgi:hypothetical protein